MFASSLSSTGDVSLCLSTMGPCSASSDPGGICYLQTALARHNSDISVVLIFHSDRVVRIKFTTLSLFQDDSQPSAPTIILMLAFPNPYLQPKGTKPKESPSYVPQTSCQDECLGQMKTSKGQLATPLSSRNNGPGDKYSSPA